MASIDSDQEETKLGRAMPAGLFRVSGQPLPQYPRALLKGRPARWRSTSVSASFTAATMGGMIGTPL